MAKIPKFNIDAAALQDKLKAQFTGLNPNDPGSWPAIPRLALCVGMTALVVVGLWFLWLNTSDEELTAERGKEVQLREDYQKKLVHTAGKATSQQIRNGCVVVRHQPGWSGSQFAV